MNLNRPSWRGTANAVPTVVRSSRRGLLACMIAALSLLTGCIESTADNEWHSQHPYTWQEWVALEAPKRAGYYAFYHRNKGLPNMANWRPEDFLPEEYLEIEHVDICSIPPEERKAISARRWSDAAPMDMREVLALAELNHSSAQSRLSPFCFANTLRVHGDPDLEFTPADALEWTRRGAASGDPLAMRRLAVCMTTIHFSVNSGMLEHPLDPFWPDQTMYWLWRAATDTLEHNAVWDMGPRSLTIYYGYGPSGRDRERAEHYMWTRLWELQSIFRRYTDRNPMFESTMQQLDDLTDEQRRLGEVLLADWLRKNHDVWDRIYSAPSHLDRHGQVHCQGEPDHHMLFHYKALNAALAPYGLKAEPPPIDLDSQTSSVQPNEAPFK